MNYKLFYFSTDGGTTEFVVISDLPDSEVITEHQDEDVRFIQAFPIKGNCSGLPTDRPLIKE